ncbi:MAG: bifunctional folylpolyglutamate synthase/dihydrofolate synthase [Tannerella sp.]|jgi:dihydrofolate synthase/folylpolyglutamate synthase|nr:bifunctional folylpolyglutamate synthase/dihydrofolate synthase [Tannerella sp.]
MNYEETLDYLYNHVLAFHKSGAVAYKPGLERSMALDELSGYPHRRYNTIHVAGTNGKGSVAHLLAATLQAAGHKVGLYTSPHLVDIRERIRINGAPVTQQFLIDFIGKNIKFIEREKPSFFELISAMAFDYFRHKKVSYAIIETGMGGRLDSTNIIQPLISIITSISLEHTQYLGDTLLEIAGEKAGIIKRNVPVVIGETNSEELDQYFTSKAFEKSAPIIFATEKDTVTHAEMQSDGSWSFETADYGILKGELCGPAQKQNAQTVLAALKTLSHSGVQIRLAAVRKAFLHVTQMTGFMGRWQEVYAAPKIVCDIGHNTGAWKANYSMLLSEAGRHEKVHMIIGLSSDKDVEGILSFMPQNAIYYFTQASGKRALAVEYLADFGEAAGLKGKSFYVVRNAIYDAIKNASAKDFIFIGGSTFVVGEALRLFPNAIK